MEIGWGHAVFTLNACWKLACIRLYLNQNDAFMQRMFGSKLLGQRGAEDYAASTTICVDEIMHMLGANASAEAVS